MTKATERPKASEHEGCDRPANAHATGPDRSDRLGAIKQVHDFGALAHGECAEASIELPRNRGLKAATLEVRIEGSAFRLNSMWALTLPPGSDACANQPESPRVVYSPPGPGSHQGRLILTARWDDGHTEREVVRLAGEGTTPTADVFKSSTPVSRMSRVHVEPIGEQIVGSRHVFPVDAPMNLGEQAAIAAASIDGDRELSAGWGMPGQVIDLEPGTAAAPIKLKYAPTASGAHRGRLNIVAHWPDRHVEQQSIEIVASARTETESPGAHDDSRRRADSALKQDDSWRSHVQTAGQNADARQLERVIDQVFSFQRDAVFDVADEQSKYSPPAAPTPLWLDLAELAITLGTSGVASLLGPVIKGRLATSLGLGAMKSADAGATRTIAKRSAQLPLFNPDEPTRAEIAGGPAPGADPSSIVSDIVGGIVGQLESAASTAAIEKVTPDGTSSSSQYSNGNSKDPAIDFFSGQRSLLKDASRRAQHAVAPLHAKLARMDSAQLEVSRLTVEVIDAAAQHVSERAKQQQKMHTTAQWFTYRSRVSLGTESVPSSTGSKTVTKLDKVREADKATPPSAARGLLDIHVSLENGQPHVNSASVLGVGWMVADRMLSVDLRAEHVPIRIVLNRGGGYITRDEAGRVRYAGLVHIDPDSHPGTVLEEKQQLRTAQRIVDSVLAKSLNEWGIQAVQTDDTSTRPPEHGRAK